MLKIEIDRHCQVKLNRCRNSYVFDLGSTCCRNWGILRLCFLFSKTCCCGFCSPTRYLATGRYLAHCHAPQLVTVSVIALCGYYSERKEFLSLFTVSQQEKQKTILKKSIPRDRSPHVCIFLLNTSQENENKIGPTFTFLPSSHNFTPCSYEYTIPFTFPTHCQKQQQKK